jgi:hypothetical protein
VENNTVTIPAWLGYVVAILMAVLITACWWLSLAAHGGNCYELGRAWERNQNPAKLYIEDGTPFLWYKGTYYKVQYVRPRVFRVME